MDPDTSWFLGTEPKLAALLETKELLTPDLRSAAHLSWKLDSLGHVPQASLNELIVGMKAVQKILEEVLGAPELAAPVGLSFRDASSGGGGSSPMAAGGGAPPPPSPHPLTRPPPLDFAAALPPLPPPAAFSAAPERPPPPAPPVNVDPPTAEMEAPTIVQLMNRAGSDERVVLAGANALCAHASRSGVVHKSALFGHTSKPNPAAGADSCVAAGAPAVLTDALRRHAGSTSVCERACEALRLIVLSHSSLAHADTTHEARAQACTPAIPQLLMMFEAQLGSASTCGNAAAAMTALVTGSNARRDAALAEGATLRLTTVLQRHKGDAAVCEGACGALRVLMVGAERTRALEAGIVPSLISALQRHSSDEAVCVGAGGALDAIIASGAAGRSAVVEAGGVPLLAAAWSAHPEGRVPFSAALRALNYNDRGAWIGEMPAEAMGARRVVEMMAQGLADKRVALAGAEALGAISDPAGGEMECVRADAVPALLTAMRLHKTDVCIAAAHALANIAAGPEACREACVAAGAAAGLVVALKSVLCADASAAEKVCKAMENIACGGEECKEAFIGCAAPAALVDALLMHRGEAFVCKFACGALMNICTGSESRKDTVSRAGALPALLAVLRSLSDDADACNMACGALRNLASSAALKPAILAASAAPLLAAALAKHTSARDYARMALNNLGCTESGALNIPLQKLIRELGSGVASPGLARAFLEALVDATGGRGSWVERDAALKRQGFNMEARCAECVAALPGVCALLESHNRDADVCECAAIVARNITGANDGLCAKAAGTIGPLLSVFIYHADTEPVCRATCAALMNLAIDKNRGEFKGAEAALVAAMKQHPSVREFAAKTLKRLNRGDLADDAAAAGTRADGERAVLAAARERAAVAPPPTFGGGLDSAAAARLLDSVKRQHSSISVSDIQRALVCLPGSLLASCDEVRAPGVRGSVPMTPSPRALFYFYLSHAFPPPFFCSLKRSTCGTRTPVAK